MREPAVTQPGTSSPTALATVRAYFALAKPRIIGLLLITTVPALFLAARGVPPLDLMFWTLLGGGLSAGSANVYNSVYDRDIDERMNRTRRRPMVLSLVSARGALIFGTVLGLASIVMLGLGANWLSAALSLAAILYYVFIYTMWLKRRTWQNIIWGGVAGCFPPLIGWTAVANSLALPPVLLFLVVFCWTPVHTWALGLRYKEDYAGVDVPMLPVIASPVAVARQIMVWAVLTVAVALALWPAAPTSWLYPTLVGASGAWLLWESAQLLRRAQAGLTDKALEPMKVFHTSNNVLALVALAATLDPLLFG